MHNFLSELGAKTTSTASMATIHLQFILLMCSHLLLLRLSMFDLQSLVTRLKENLEKMTEERDQRVTSEIREKDQNKRMQRQIRDIKEEMTELSKKETEASRKKHELVSSRAGWRLL